MKLLACVEGSVSPLSASTLDVRLAKQNCLNWGEKNAVTILLRGFNQILSRIYLFSSGLFLT